MGGTEFQGRPRQDSRRSAITNELFIIDGLTGLPDLRASELVDCL